MLPSARSVAGSDRPRVGETWLRDDNDDRIERSKGAMSSPLSFLEQWKVTNGPCASLTHSNTLHLLTRVHTNITRAGVETKERSSLGQAVVLAMVSSPDTSTHTPF